MTKPLVSLVVPAHNAEHQLPVLLTSLEYQMDSALLEVLVVDDGSSDATAAVAESFRDRLPGLTVIRHQVPKGAAGSRNEAMARARGKYLGFMDADDWLAPGHLRVMADQLDQLGCDFVRVDHIRAEGLQRQVISAPESRRGQVLSPRDGIAEPSGQTMLDYAYPWAGLFRSEVRDAGLLTFNPELRTAADRPWIWRLHLTAESYAVVPAPGVFYRRDVSDSLTRVHDDRRTDFAVALLEVHTVLDADPDHTALVTKLARTSLGLITHHLSSVDRLDDATTRQLVTRSAALLRSFDPDVLSSQFDHIGPDRRTLLAAFPGLLPDNILATA